MDTETQNDQTQKATNRATKSQSEDSIHFQASHSHRDTLTKLIFELVQSCTIIKLIPISSVIGRCSSKALKFVGRTSCTVVVVATSPLYYGKVDSPCSCVYQSEAYQVSFYVLHTQLYTQIMYNQFHWLIHCGIEVMIVLFVILVIHFRDV